MRTTSAIWAGAAAALSAALLFGGPAGAQVTVNNRQISYQAAPFSIGSFYMVPLRETLNAIGGTVTWDAPGQSARFNYQGTDVTIRRGSGYATVNGRAVTMGVPAVTRGGDMFIPLSFLREDLGMSVDISPRAANSQVRSTVLGFRGTPAPVEQLHPGEVAIGGVNVIRLDSAAGFASVGARATDVMERLTTGLQRAMQRDNGAFFVRRVQLGAIGGQPVILVGGVPVVTVTSQDAAANNTDVETLARMWLNDIRMKLAQIYPRH